MISYKFTIFLSVLYTGPSSSEGEECAANTRTRSSSDEILLNNGARMPVIGLGTAGFTDGQLVQRAVLSALKAGYRMIDTADLYSNHKQIAASLATSLPQLGLAREQLFLTTKLRPTDLGYLQCKFAVRRFLEELSTSYLDLVLIHAPDVPPILGMAPSRSDQRRLRLETWKCLEEFNKEGVIKSIGVSNYDVEHIKEILDSHGMVPQVNQVYKTPFQDQERLQEFAGKYQIHLQAYSSLGSSSRNRILGNSVINKIAKKLSVSPARVILNWLVREGWSVLPKSQDPKHLEENLDLDFNINSKDIERLSSLAK